MRLGTTWLEQVLVVACIVIATPCAAPAQSTVLPAEAQKAFELGRAAFQQRDFAEASRQLNAAYKLAPDFAEICLSLAEVNEQWPGREPVAIAWLRAYLAMASGADGEPKILARIAALEQRVEASARMLASRAATTTSNLAPRDRVYRLTRVAEIQARSGDANSSLATISSLSAQGADRYSVKSAYASVAAACATRRDFGCVEDIYRRAADNDERSDILQKASSALAYDKQFADALGYASRLTGASGASAYMQIAEKQVEAADEAGASRSIASAVTALRQAGPNASFYNIASLVDMAQSLGELDRTARDLSMFPQGDIRLQGLAALAIAYAGAGDRGAALEHLRLAADTFYGINRDLTYAPSQHYQLLLQVSGVLEANDIGARLLAAFQSSARGNDTYAAQRRAEGLAAAGRFSEAENVAERISEPQQRTYAFDSIGRMRVERARLLARAGRLDEALAVGSTLRDSQQKDSWRYNVSSEIRTHAERLLKRNEYDAAAAAAARIPDDYYRTRKIGEIAEKRSQQLTALIAAGDLAIAEAALAHETAPGSLALPRLQLAKAYFGRSDAIGVRRALELAASSVAQASLQFYDFGEYARICNELIQLFVETSDFAAAARLADAAGRSIAAANVTSNDASSRDSALRSIAIARAKIGKASIQAEQTSSLKAAIAVASNIKDGDTRASTLAEVVEQLPRLGAAREILALARSLPSGYARDRVLASIVGELSAEGPLTEAVATAAMIADDYQRRTALSRILAPQIAKENWSAAVAVANDPVKGDAAAAELAGKLIAAGMFDQAAAMEARFAGKSELFDSYLSSAANARTANGEFDSALKLALRQSTSARRAQTLLGLVATVKNLAGAAAAQPFYDAAMAQYAAALDPNARAELCMATRQSWAHGSTSQMEPPGPRIGTACLAEALAKPDLKERLSALSGVLSRPTLVTRPLPGGILIAARPTASRWLAESQQHSDTRSYHPAYVAGFFASDGAIELATQIVDTYRGSGFAMQIDAIRLLVESGAAASAQEIAGKLVAAVEARGEAYARDSGYSDLVQVMNALGEFEKAESFADRISTPNYRLSAYLAIGRVAVDRGRFDMALRMIARARRLTDTTANFASSFANLAADAGDKNIEAWIDLVASANTDPLANSSYFARATAIRALLRWRQPERASALIERQETTLKQADATSRAALADSLALIYGWTGNVAGLGRLVLEAGLPSRRTSLLIAAAGGLAKAGKLDEARTTLQRALASLQITRPDGAAWMDYQIALALEEVDPAQAEKLAIAIPDPEWRSRAVASLAQTRLGKNDLAGVAALLRAAPASAASNLQLPRVARFLAGKNDLDGARELMSKATHPGVRDEVRRQIALAVARSGSAQLALSEANAVEDLLIRAYTLADVGAALATRSASGQSELGYFAQLSLFSVTKLADGLDDPIHKADVLSTVAHAQDRLSAANAAATRQRAESVIASISDPAWRAAARFWLAPLPGAPKLSASATRERDDWVGYLSYPLSEPIYSNMDAFVQASAAKPTGEAVDAYLSGADSLLTAIRSMREKSRSWAEKTK